MVARGKKGPRQGNVSPDHLGKLLESKMDLDEKSAIAAEARAKFDRLVIQQMALHKKPHEVNLICLECGLIFPRNQQGCPTCSRG